MQVKDFVDLFSGTGQLLVSLATFLVALVVAITTARSGKTDEQRTIRNQLTDTFNRLFETYIKGREQQEALGNGDFLLAQDTSSVLNQQYFTLLGQATFLINKIEKLVTPVEYNTIAVAHGNYGDFQLANKYAQKAIDVCEKDDLNSRVGMTTSYGTLLFMQSRFEDGNAKFQEALDLLKQAKPEKNFAHYLTGQLHMQWAMYQKQWAVPEGTPDEHFKDAEAEFQAITIPAKREQALQVLHQAKSAIATAPLPNIVQTQGVQIQPSIFNQMHTPGES